MNWEERITVDPGVLGGKPVVRGTRLAVEFVLELLAEDWSEEQILDNYPGLTHEDISACLHYAGHEESRLRMRPLPGMKSDGLSPTGE